MKDRKLAVRYARALFAVFPDPTTNEPIERFLTNVGQALETDHVLRVKMLDPAVPRSMRKTALTGLAARSGLPQGVSNFLSTVVDNNRIAALPSISIVFREMREEAMGIVPAEIITPGPLGDGDRERAQSAVKKLTGRDVRMTFKVEPAMVGGATTRIGSTIYDGSLRTQLAQLKRRMAEE